MGRPMGRNLIPLAAFLAVFAIKAAGAAFMRSPWIIPDETDYAAAAWSTWDRGQLVPEFRGGQPFPPGYSVVLAPACAVPDMRLTYHLMLAVNCLLTTLVGVVAYVIVRQLIAHLPGSYGPASGTAGQDRPWHTPDGFALVIGLAAALAPSTWLYSYVLMSENLFVLLFALSCLGALRMGQGIGGAALLGLLWGAMFVTRSISVALLPAVLVACLAGRRGPGRRLVRVVLAALGAAAVVGPWLFYKSHVADRTLTGYSEESYLRVLGGVLSGVSALGAYVRLVANDLAAVGVLSGGVFLVFALGGVWHGRSGRAVPSPAPGAGAWEEEADRRTLWLYVFVGLAGTIALAGLHQYRPAMERVIAEYNVLSRYFDPLVPMVIALGGVGLWRWSIGRRSAAVWVRLGLLSLAVFALMAFVLPTGPYKVPNTLGLWHVAWLRDAAAGRLGEGLAWLGPMALYAMFAVVTAGALLSRGGSGVPRPVLSGRVPRRNRRGWGWPTAAVALLVLCGVPTLKEVLRASRATAHGLRAGIALRDGGALGAAVYVDETAYAVAPLAIHRETLLIRFWNPRAPVIHRWREALRERPRYLLSAEDWPYPVFATHQDGLWRLYDAAEELAETGRKGVFIDPATWPADRFEGFYEPSEDGYRWTSGRAAVRLGRLPAGGDLEFLLGLGGGRPTTEPAGVEVFFDGQLVHQFEKARGGLYPAFTVPVALLAADADHRLELVMNTFRPADFPGWPKDSRDLGVQLLWLRIRPTPSGPASVPSVRQFGRKGLHSDG